MVTTNSPTSEQTFPLDSQSYPTNPDQRMEMLQRDLIGMVADLVRAVHPLQRRLAHVELELKALKIIHKAHWRTASPAAPENQQAVEPAVQS